MPTMAPGAAARMAAHAQGRLSGVAHRYRSGCDKIKCGLADAISTSAVLRPVSPALRRRAEPNKTFSADSIHRPRPPSSAPPSSFPPPPPPPPHPMAFVQKAPPRGRCSSDAGSVRGVRPATPDPPATDAFAPAGQETPAYAPLRMANTPDGSQLFSFPDSVHEPLSMPEAPTLPPEIDAELDLLALPPSSSRTSVASLPLNPTAGDEAYSSVSEIFSPSGLSASELDVGISDSEVIVGGFAMDAEGSTNTGTGRGTDTGTGTGTGTGGWARWATARAAWIEAQTAAAQARRPSIVSLASSSLSGEDRPRRSRAQRSPYWDVPAAAPSGNNNGMIASWSWTNVPGSGPASDAETRASPVMVPILSEASARGLVLLDELDVFDDEMQSTRRGTPVARTAAATPTEAWPHATLEGLSGLLPGSGERSGIATPCRVRSVAPSRTPSLLHLRHDQPMVRTRALDRTRPPPRDNAEPEPVDVLLATAPGAESAGLHKPRRRGMKRVRGSHTLQGTERASDVWSRLHGDYGRFTPAEAYSSDSDASVEAVRSSKRSTASVSTARRLQLGLRQREGPSQDQGRGRDAPDWPTHPGAPAAAGHAHEPPGCPATPTSPAPVPSKQEGLVSALWRRVFAVDQDVVDAFMAAEVEDPILAPHASSDTAPLGVGRQPPVKFGFGDNDPDAGDNLLVQTREEALSKRPPPSPPATPVRQPSPAALPAEAEEASSRATTKVDDYLLPLPLSLPLLGQLESLAAASRTSRAPPPISPHKIPRRARSFPYGRMPIDPPLEPSTGEALQALLGSIGAQLQSQVERHFFFLSFARGLLARTRHAPPDNAPAAVLNPTLGFSPSPSAKGGGLTRTRSLSVSSADTVARYQLGE